jgi:hypothetical protein
MVVHTLQVLHMAATGGEVAMLMYVSVIVMCFALRAAATAAGTAASTTPDNS